MGVFSMFDTTFIVRCGRLSSGRWIHGLWAIDSHRQLLGYMYVATLRMCISFGGFLLEILAIEGSGDEDVAAAAGGF